MPADLIGCIPLHVACLHGLSVEGVKTLVRADETSVHVIDKDSELPLHKACRGGHTDPVNFLVEIDAPSTGVRTYSGALPAYLLCQKSGKKDPAVINTPQFTEAVWMLLIAHPEALRMT